MPDDQYIQVGVTAMRAPDGSFLPSVPLYIKATPEALAGQDALIHDIARLFAQRMKQYQEGTEMVEKKPKPGSSKKKTKP